MGHRNHGIALADGLTTAPSRCQRALQTAHKTVLPEAAAPLSLAKPAKPRAHQPGDGTAISLSGAHQLAPQSEAIENPTTTGRPMIVYTVMPLIAKRHHPTTPGFRPLDMRRSLYDALHKSSKTSPPMPADTLSKIALDDNFSAIVQREEDREEHPIATLILTLGGLRDRGLDLKAENAGLLGDDTPLTIPGQANSTSIIASQFRPIEGVVLIVCDEDDWIREFNGSLGDADGVMPALRDLESGDLVQYGDSERGSYYTSDGRAIVLDVSFFDVHDTLDLAEGETWPVLLDYAAGHARQSYDIGVAARLFDRLGQQAGDDHASRASRLTQLRHVQMRFAARGIETLLEHQTYEPYIGDDGFRIRHRLNQQLNQMNSAADRKVSDAFARFQQLIETTEADAEATRQLRTETLTKRAGGIVAGAGLLGIFASIAAIPRSGAALSPNLRAAFATLALAGAVAVVALLLERALEAQRPTGDRARRAAKIVGWLLLAAGLLGAWLAWLGRWASSSALLIAVIAMILIGGTLLLAVRSDETPERSSR